MASRPFEKGLRAALALLLLTALWSIGLRSAQAGVKKIRTAVVERVDRSGKFRRRIDRSPRAGDQRQVQGCRPSRGSELFRESFLGVLRDRCYGHQGFNERSLGTLDEDQREPVQASLLSAHNASSCSGVGGVLGPRLVASWSRIRYNRAYTCHKRSS